MSRNTATCALVACHADYWRFDASRLAQLEGAARRGALGAEALRWHQLRCLAVYAGPAEDRVSAVQAAIASAAVLGQTHGLRPRFGRVWLEGADAPVAQGCVDTQPLTHPGVLEYIALDDSAAPTGVHFVAWADLRSVSFGPPAEFRVAVLTFEDEARPAQLVRVPTRHGPTLGYGPAPVEIEQSGQLGRFGLETQDLSVTRQGLPARFMAQAISRVVLDPDPGFDAFEAQCARRGVTPAEARARYNRHARAVRRVRGLRSPSGAFPVFS